MVSVHTHSEDSSSRNCGRLNLLLTSGGWRREPWVESLPALMKPMGVEAWRARTGDEAARLIREIPIHIAVVDLALPLADGAKPETDEGGARLIQLLGRLQTPPPTIVVQRARTSRDRSRELAQALNLGVFAVMHRPVNMEVLLDTFRRVLRRHYQDRWPDDAGVSAPPESS